MTNLFPNSVVDTKVAIELAELNVKTMSELVDNQAKLFNDLLSSGLNQMKSLQKVTDVNELIETNKTYTQEVEQKLRTSFDSNFKVFDTANKKSIELLSKEQKVQAAK